MKYHVLIWLILFCFLKWTVTSAQTWNQKALFHSDPLNRACAFSIPSMGMGYVIAGYDHIYQTNAWEYDTLTNIWSPIAPFPGALSAQVAFSIGNYGYVGTGTGANYSYDSTFWKYDPNLNTWTKLTHFPGAPRAFAVGFSVGGKGYIGGGCDGIPGSAQALHDFYQYNPTTNTWASVTSYPGHGCVGAVGFSIGLNGYACTGDSITDVDFTKVTTSALYEYNPTGGSGGTWTAKTNFGGGTRGEGMGFSTCSNGYVGCGYSNGGQSKFNEDFWEYNPGSNSWSSIANFGGDSCAYGTAFCIGQSGFVGFGRPNANSVNKGDWWEYITPDPIAQLTILPQPPPLYCSCCIDPTTLEVQGGGSDFIWSPSLGLSATTGSSVVATPTLAITYTAMGYDSVGCYAIGTEPINVLTSQNAPSFYQCGDTLISSSHTDNQWYYNNTLLLDDTMQHLLISDTGWYYLAVENEANGCIDYSDTLHITNVSDTCSGNIEQITIPTSNGYILCELQPSSPSSILTNDFDLNFADRKQILTIKTI